MFERWKQWLCRFRWRQWGLFVCGVTLIKLSGKIERIEDGISLPVVAYWCIGILCLILAMEE